MKVHAIQTGRVQIKQSQIEGQGHGMWRRAQPFLSREWADWSPTYAWAIEHPEGVIVVDTGEAAHLKSPVFSTGRASGPIAGGRSLRVTQKGWSRLSPCVHAHHACAVSIRPRNLSSRPKSYRQTQPNAVVQTLYRHWPVHPWNLHQLSTVRPARCNTNSCASRRMSQGPTAKLPAYAAVAR
jgi:hypothetical protein